MDQASGEEPYSRMFGRSSTSPPEWVFSSTTNDEAQINNQNIEHDSEKEDMQQLKEGKTIS